MHCQFRKLHFEHPGVIDRMFIGLEDTVALTDKEGGVQLYVMREDSEETTFISTFMHHKGPVMDVAFTSMSHPFYLLTCSYDRSISLRSKDGQVFSYQEEDSSMGFFVCCTFVATETNVLRFLAGNSNGYVFDFDSRNGFEPTKHSVFTESVMAIDSLDDNCILVCGSSGAPRLYTDRSFQEFVEIGSNTGSPKIKTAKLCGDQQEARLLLINESNQVEVFCMDRNTQAVVREAELQLSHKVLSASWNFSGLSASILVFETETDSFQLKLLKQSLEANGEWRIQEVTTEKTE